MSTDQIELQSQLKEALSGPLFTQFLNQRYAKNGQQSLKQWFSTFDSWRPTKQNNTQFGDPYIDIIEQ